MTTAKVGSYYKHIYLTKADYDAKSAEIGSRLGVASKLIRELGSRYFIPLQLVYQITAIEDNKCKINTLRYIIGNETKDGLTKMSLSNVETLATEISVEEAFEILSYNPAKFHCEYHLIDSAPCKIDENESFSIAL